MTGMRTRHVEHVCEHGVDMPEARDWIWSG